MKQKIAPISLRFTAYLIDLFIFLLVCQLVLYYFVSVTNLHNILSRGLESVILFLTICLVIPFLYSWMISSYGGTIGKLICGISVVTPLENRISFKRAFFRNTVGYMVSSTFVFLGFIWILKDERKRGWHDMVSETEVMQVRPSSLIIPAVVVIGLVVANIVILSSNLASLNDQIPLYQQVGEMLQKEFITPTPSPFDMPGTYMY